MLKKIMRAYKPWNEQEARDQQVILRAMEEFSDCFSRENLLAHFTASAWITNRERSKVLLAYHKIYGSWAWTGGHADGEKNLLAVALREAEEETGVHARPLSREIFSLEVLHVMGHEKRGIYVPCHLHLNATYLLEADEGESIRIQPDENSGVGWFTLADAEKISNEPWMVERIYRKLNEKLRAFDRGERK